MSDIHPKPAEHVAPLVRLGRFLKDNPVIPLIGFLFALIGILELMRPGIVSVFWSETLIKFCDLSCCDAGSRAQCLTHCLTCLAIDFLSCRTFSIVRHLFRLRHRT